jgi:glycosyltransferase involved in cell wall biosynthesis
MNRAAIPSRPKLLFVVTEDWYFVSHRLPLAVAARKAGYEVSVATRVSCHGPVIRDAGIQLFPIAFDRSGTRPTYELATVAALVRLYRHENPEIVHHVGLKPVIYGSLAARIVGIPGVVNALAGLGFAFSSTSPFARLIRLVAAPALKVALRNQNSRLILQNSHDRQTLISAGLTRADSVRLIRGAGVDPARYPGSNVAVEPPLVILPARMLREKGVGEFVEAARLLRARGVKARFALIGRPDPMNPASIPQSAIDAWHAEGAIEAWGWQPDMPSVFAKAQIVCLPTYYGEGLPKSLLEAAASGCAIVATDVPGCRDIVQDRTTGLLVPPRDVGALVDALATLIDNVTLRSELGSAARISVAADFSLDQVISETLRVYAELSAVGA